MKATAIPDSSTLIALEAIGQLELLKELFDEIVIPKAVAEETGIKPAWATIREAKAKAFPEVVKIKMGAGETGAIAIAFEITNPTLILDDKQARRIAKEMNFRITGVVGLLITAKEEGLIPAIKPLLLRCKEKGFHLSETIIQQALARAKE